MEEQVQEWNLPPAPAKVGDSRTAAWDGLGQVELDAVDLNVLRALCQEAIDDHFDTERYDELQEQENEEGDEYRTIIRNFINNLDL